MRLFLYFVTSRDLATAVAAAAMVAAVTAMAAMAAVVAVAATEAAAVVTNLQWWEAIAT